MKTMKKLMALALVFTLVLAMAATVSAGTITVSDSLDGVIYKAYRILDLVTAGDLHYYTSVAEWQGFWTATVPVNGNDIKISDYFTVATVKINGSDVTTVTPKENFVENDSYRAVVALAAQQYAKNNGITPVESDEGIGGLLTLAENDAAVTAGYYLLTCGDNAKKASLELLKTDDGTVNLVEKNQLPNVKKTASNITGKAGDVIDFTITVETEENIKNERKYVVHDKMGEGLELVANSIVVKHNENTLTQDTDYVLTLDTDHCTFEVSFTENLTTKANDIITVEYQAKIKTIGNNTNMTNKAWLSSGGSDHEDEENIYSYDFTVNKVDQNNELITSGEATFGLYADEKCEIEIKLIKDASGTYYRPATEEEIQNDSTLKNEFTTTGGIVALKGFAAGTYYVKEIAAPGGYVKTDAVFTINLIDVKGAVDAEGNVVPDGKLDEESTETVRITNVKAEELPSTGGIGTTMFYMVGGVLATGALTLLIAKKRVEDEE